ncbi:MAG: PEP-CTERM sorting domain-containing protein [Rhodanobacteraceae bacterium]
MKHVIRGQRWLAGAIAAAALVSMSAWASATPTTIPTSGYYTTQFTTLNDSGVTGSASVRLNGNLLTVHINATGLQPGVSHAQHLHGPLDANGNPIQATVPTLAADDTNGDGFIELGEGQMAYGPILVPLSIGAGTGVFPTEPNGTLNYTQTFDLTNPATYHSALALPGANEADLFPLNFREIVLHGMDAPVDITNDALGLSFTKGEYDPVFPVAAGVLMTAVPEPADLGMMGGGLALLFGLLWLRRRRVEPDLS